MRNIFPTFAAIAIFSVNVSAVPAPKESKPAEPTAEQLAAAKAAFAKFGAEYIDPKEKGELHDFFMPDKTADADLKGLPDLPFPFMLSLFFSKVTDAGLKELKELKNLSGLRLFGTKVTDAGMKEIKELKNLSLLDLGSTEITDAGLKELKELKNLLAFPFHQAGDRRGTERTQRTQKPHQA